MFELILSIIISTILSNVDLPSVEHEFFIEQPVVSQQPGGDIVVDGHLPLAANKILAPQKINQNSLGVEVTAQSGIVVDWPSNKVLWEKNSAQQRSIASLTKLMTALVFLDYNPGWQQPITITVADQCEGGVAFLYPGEVISTKDLFYLSLVRSINSAAAALARSTGLSEEEFVTAMNQKAQDLDMKNTHFVEPTGLHIKNVSPAQDLAILIKQALTNPEIVAATSLTEYSATILNKRIKRRAQNTDWLLNSFLNQEPYKVIGGKTGYLIEAGYCLGLGVENQGRRVISIILGSDSIESRFQDTKGVIDWVFRNYSWNMEHGTQNN